MRRLDGDQIDELSLLYRRASSDLAMIRATMPDPDLIHQLSNDLARARSRLTGTSGASLVGMARWFKVTLPAALYEVRWWTIGIMALFLTITITEIVWLGRNPAAIETLMEPEAARSFVFHDFVEYYSQDTNAQFGASVWFNNAFIAIQMIGAGITGIMPFVIIYNNAVSIGVTGALVVHYAGPAFFLHYILPHGLPELTAIFIAGAAGLRLFWALISPGGTTRGRALARAGRSMVVICGGLVILLAISGFIEGFVTPSSLPNWIRIGSGVLVITALWLYTFILGGRAHKLGIIGDLESDAGYAQPVAA